MTIADKTFTSPFDINPQDPNGQWLGATGTRWNLGTELVGFFGTGTSNRIAIPTGDDYALRVSDATDDEYLRFDTDNEVNLVGKVVRGTTNLYRRYYHLNPGSFDPGASGAVWVDASANGPGGWELDADTDHLHGNVDVHADWNGASDLIVEVYFQIVGASVLNDTVDIRIQFFYMGVGEVAAKSQTVEVATNVGDGGAKAALTMFEAEFIIDWDDAGNVVEVGDQIGFLLNLETDTSEVDDIIVNNMTFFYETTHLGIEGGDV